MPERRTVTGQRRTARNERDGSRAAGRDSRDGRDEEPDDDEEPEAEASPAEAFDDDRPARRISAAQAAQAGRRGLLELIGKRAEGVTAVEPTDDGWVVGVEVLEDQRVPSSADLLAMYEVTLDQEGNLMSYRRTRRYSRGRGDSDGGR